MKQLAIDIQKSFKDSLLALKTYCEAENFAGWDPYDGLNSKIFQAAPLKKWDLARLAWIQAFKRNPINLRKIFMVPKEHNPKGISLMLTGYCNLHKYLEKTGENAFGTEEEILQKINRLADLLLSLQSKGYSGACWGYNFDWQGRRLFFFPKYTPTVVVTSFCATALFNAYEITGKEIYLNSALSSAEFVLNDLNRTPINRGFLFSYSPLDGNNTVYNASLLGSALLSICFYYTGKALYSEAARSSVKACVGAQNHDGSWFYGQLPVQKWIDGFHTGYNLDGLITYKQYTEDHSFETAIDKGFDFYISNFFLDAGTPKYYHNKTYPIDIHCPAQLFVTLSRLGKFKVHEGLADKVMLWAIKYMQNKEGYFYYQLKQWISSKIPYMRWSNAFMFYAMSFYLIEKSRKNI